MTTKPSVPLQLGRGMFGVIAVALAVIALIALAVVLNNAFTG